MDLATMFGALEGSDPPPLFSNEAYLATNPDVNDAVTLGAIPSGINHYLTNDAAERSYLA